MTELQLSIGEPFTSPAWGSNLVVFSGADVIPEDSSKEYLRRVCKYARNFEVYLVPERFMLMGYQCLCLISPQGKVMGAQKGLFLNTESRIGKRSGSLEILHTEFGGVFLCVDTDVYHPEVARIASGMGAQYIFCAQTIDPKDYNSSMILTGAWNAAQLGCVYTVAVGGEFHCVCAPLPLTEHGDGFVRSPSLKLPMTAKLDAGRLFDVPQPHHLSRKFYAVHRNDLLR